MDKAATVNIEDQLEHDWKQFVLIARDINKIGCHRPIYLIRNLIDPTYWRRGIA